jgi:Holliday junction resolvase-like predicted endonuclease
VVQGDEGIVFVEVRTKRRPCLFSPEETITYSKARRLVRLAEHYLVATSQEESPWRVDLVAVELGSRGEPVRIERFRDATADLVGR